MSRCLFSAVTLKRIVSPVVALATVALFVGTVIMDPVPVYAWCQGGHSENFEVCSLVSCADAQQYCYEAAFNYMVANCGARGYCNDQFIPWQYCFTPEEQYCYVYGTPGWWTFCRMDWGCELDE